MEKHTKGNYEPPKKFLQDLKGYKIVGGHSAVKLCLWLKRSLRDRGVCYKQKFYGINSHRCLQMTPALMCNQSCIYCWRPLDLLPGVKGWDSADFVAEECIKAQKVLLSGFGGLSDVNRRKLEEAKKPNQVAISLIGEPTLYPYLDELVDIFNSKGMTTFVVTNGTKPEMVEKIDPYQLYVSLTAYSEESHAIINRPAKNYWNEILKSLKILANKDCRTVIRLTLIKGLNMIPENFVELLDMASPDFIEAKAYMHLGYSRMRLERSAMPSHDEVRAFAEELERLTGYEIKNESKISRVTLLTK
ncbi:MAG: 4-demethylwyosine synthase TYW1 [Archaeoglobus sp.]|nr:MAG: 4-demethylwyosine synthase TYW1 [Archaeoglobus sp.]